MATTTQPQATATTRRTPAREEAWTGWVGFAAIMVLLVAAISFFEGLIGVIRKTYFVIVGNQVVVFDLRTWGWIMLVWGVVLGFAAFALAARRGWGRWFALVFVSLNVLGQLGFLGSTQYPLWTLTAIAIDATVIYALTARWGREG